MIAARYEPSRFFSIYRTDSGNFRSHQSRYYPCLGNFRIRYRPIGDFTTVRRQLTLMSIVCLANAERVAGQPDADSLVFYRPLRDLPPWRLRNHLFCTASAMFSAFNHPSPSIFFNRRFSSSSSLFRAITETSMPRNLLRQR